MDSFEHKKDKDDGSDDSLARMMAAGTGKEHGRTTAEETKQQQQQPSSHSHGRHHHHQRKEEEEKKHVAAEGSRMELVDYIDHDAASTAGAFLEMKLLKATGKTYDKREWLIGPDQVAKDDKEDAGGTTENSKGGTIVYEF